MFIEALVTVKTAIRSRISSIRRISGCCFYDQPEKPKGNDHMLQKILLGLCAGVLLLLSGCPDYSHLNDVPDYSTMTDGGGEVEDESVP